MNVINEMGALPTRNHRDVQFENAGKISAEAMHEKRPTDGKANLVTNQACFGCTIACGRISKIDETHFTVVNKPRVLGRVRRPRVRSGVGAGRGDRRRRPRGADLRQFRLQRGRHRPDLVRRDGRRGDGALRPRPHQGSRRRLPADVRLGGGADQAGRDDRRAARASARRSRWAASACARSTAGRSCRCRSRARNSRPTTRAASRAWASPTPRRTAARATCAATRSRPRCSASR